MWHRRFLWERFALMLPAAASAVACWGLMGPRVRGIFLNTVQLSLGTVAIAVPVGTILALLLAKTDLAKRHVFLVGFTAMLFLPLVLQVAGWQAGLGVHGFWGGRSVDGFYPPLLDGWWGAIGVHAIAAVPWVVLIVVAGLRAVPAAAEEAASLVASPLQVLRSVTLPAAAPSLVLVTLWIVLTCAADMTVTDFFQIRTFAEEIYTEAAAGGFSQDQLALDAKPEMSATGGGNFGGKPPRKRPVSGLLPGVLLLTTVAIVTLQQGNHWLVMISSASRTEPWRWQLGDRRWWATGAVLLVGLGIAGLPVAALIYQAGKGAVETTAGWQPTWSLAKLFAELGRAVSWNLREWSQTILLGIAVAVACTVLGLLAAWRWRTCRRSPWGGILLLALALAVPGPLLGVGVIRLLNHPTDSFLAPLTWAYDYTLLAPWLVQTVRFTPIAAMVLAAALAQVPQPMLDAARADGASGFAGLWQIALPLSWRSVVVTWLVVFALSVGELAATLLVIPPGPQTITIRLFSLLHYGADDRVAALGLVLLGGMLLMGMVVIGLVGWTTRAEEKDTCRVSDNRG